MWCSHKADASEPINVVFAGVDVPIGNKVPTRNKVDDHQQKCNMRIAAQESHRGF